MSATTDGRGIDPLGLTLVALGDGDAMCVDGVCVVPGSGGAGAAVGAHDAAGAARPRDADAG